MSAEINNEFYNELGGGWMNRADHPVALLRAENALRAPWICREIRKRIGSRAKILDVGCGAGLLTNHLAQNGYDATGIDLSASSLDIASKMDVTKTVQYQHANAYALPFPNNSFDVVCAMDILEHVEVPNLLIAEASRVLRPEGLLFFHTFNRNLLSYFFIIKGVEWFVPNTPSNMHVYSLFIRPDELEEMLQDYKLKPVEWHGFVPKILSPPLVKMLLTRRVPSNFSFRFSRSKLTGYCGIAEKQLSY